MGIWCRFLLVGILFAVSTLKVQAVSSSDGVLPCINKTFSIIAHIVRDAAGEAGVMEASITNQVNVMNQYFDPICVTFEVCEFRYIDNFQYDSLEQFSEWQAMDIKYHENNRINMFFVTFASPTVGFTALNGIQFLETGGICVVKSAVTAMSHEMGHYFGLYDTYESTVAELVDGSNCANAGDSICDTPADPYVSGDNVNNYLSGCRFISELKDANDEYYNPDVGNIMSPYPVLCWCGFTREQYVRMVDTYRSSNPKMW